MEKDRIAQSEFDAGVHYAYHFDANGAAGASANASWSWIGHALADMRGRRRIETDASLPESVRDVLVGENDAPVIAWRDGWMIGILPDFRHQTYGEGGETSLLRFAFNDRLLLTARRQPLQMVDDIRQQIEKQGRRLGSPAAVIEAIVERLLVHLNTDVNENARQLDKIEDRVVGEKWGGERESLSAVRRRIVSGQRMLTGLNTMFARFAETDSRTAPGDLASTIDELGRRASGLLHDSEQLQARARLLQDELMALLGEQSNRLLHTLSVLTSVMMPATIITGLFGMNVDGMPLAGAGWGFAAAAAISALASALVYFIVRSRGRTR